MKIDTDISTSIAVSTRPMSKAFITDVIVFNGNVTETDNFQYENQLVDTYNITHRYIYIKYQTLKLYTT